MIRKSRSSVEPSSRQSLILSKIQGLRLTGLMQTKRFHLYATIRDEYAASGGSPNFERLTNDILFDVIDEQPACRLSIVGRSGFGEHSCNYAFQINNDFQCSTWTAFLQQCPGQTAEACFQSLLTSKLIEGAALRLYNSSYCQKEMDTYPVDTSRRLVDVDVVPEGIVV